MSNSTQSSQRYTLKNRPTLPLAALAGAALIVALVFIAYAPSISGGFILDDDKLLTNNYLIRASDGLCRFWCTTEAMDYWPVTNSTFWIEWRLWGMNPTGYHVINLTLHIVESLLIWIILRKLSIPGAYLAAIIFAVHPVNVESVAWISQRKNLLAMLFFLLSILCYLKIEIPLPSSQNGLNGTVAPLASRRWPLWYWLSLAAFVLAMLSKGSVAVLPVLLLGIIWWLRPLTRWDLIRTAPFFLVGAALAGINIWFQTHGEELAIRSAGFTERLLGAGGVVWFYLYKAILPLDLAFVYPQWHIRAGNPLWWLPLLLVLAVTAVLWRYRKNWSRPFLFAWGFFCVALIPVLGFTYVGFMRYSLVADHYQHIAIIFVITLAAALWSTWFQRAQETTRWAASAIAIATIGALTFLTWHQSSSYRDAITLYQTALEKNPGFWVAHNNMGLVLDTAGRPQEAIEHYQQAMRIKPDYADPYYNMGLTLSKMGRTYEAIEHYEQALRLKPNYPAAHCNMGAIYKELGYYSKAIEHYQQALQLNPDLFEAHYNLGNAMFNLGQFQEATEHYLQTLRLNPSFAEAYSNLACIYVQTNRHAEVIPTAQKALELARTQGKTALAKKIEDWLNAYEGQGTKEMLDAE